MNKAILKEMTSGLKTFFTDIFHDVKIKDDATVKSFVSHGFVKNFIANSLDKVPDKFEHFSKKNIVKGTKDSFSVSPDFEKRVMKAQAFLTKDKKQRGDISKKYDLGNIDYNITKGIDEVSNVYGDLFAVHYDKSGEEIATAIKASAGVKIPSLFPDVVEMTKDDIDNLRQKQNVLKNKLFLTDRELKLKNATLPDYDKVKWAEEDIPDNYKVIKDEKGNISYEPFSIKEHYEDLKTKYYEREARNKAIDKLVKVQDSFISKAFKVVGDMGDNINVVYRKTDKLGLKLAKDELQKVYINWDDSKNSIMINQTRLGAYTDAITKMGKEDFKIFEDNKKVEATQNGTVYEGITFDKFMKTYKSKSDAEIIKNLMSKSYESVLKEMEMDGNKVAISPIDFMEHKISPEVYPYVSRNKDYQAALYAMDLTQFKVPIKSKYYSAFKDYVIAQDPEKFKSSNDISEIFSTTDPKRLEQYTNSFMQEHNYTSDEITSSTIERAKNYMSHSNSKIEKDLNKHLDLINTKLVGFDYALNKSSNKTIPGDALNALTKDVNNLKKIFSDSIRSYDKELGAASKKFLTVKNVLATGALTSTRLIAGNIFQPLNTLTTIVGGRGVYSTFKGGGTALLNARRLFSKKEMSKFAKYIKDDKYGVFAAYLDKFHLGSSFDETVWEGFKDKDPKLNSFLGMMAHPFYMSDFITRIVGLTHAVDTINKFTKEIGITHSILREATPEQRLKWFEMFLNKGKNIRGFNDVEVGLLKSIFVEDGNLNMFARQYGTHLTNKAFFDYSNLGKPSILNKLRQAHPVIASSFMFTSFPMYQSRLLLHAIQTRDTVMLRNFLVNTLIWGGIFSALGYATKDNKNYKGTNGFANYMVPRMPGVAPFTSIYSIATQNKLGFMSTPVTSIMYPVMYGFSKIVPAMNPKNMRIEKTQLDKTIQHLYKGDYDSAGKEWNTLLKNVSSTYGYPSEMADLYLNGTKKH